MYRDLQGFGNRLRLNMSDFIVKVAPSTRNLPHAMKNKFRQQLLPIAVRNFPPPAGILQHCIPEPNYIPALYYYMVFHRPLVMQLASCSLLVGSYYIELELPSGSFHQCAGASRPRAGKVIRLASTFNNQ